MKVIKLKDVQKKELIWIINQLNSGYIGILPTDTIYGIHVKALSKTAVEKVYGLKKRGTKKPMIILISSLKDLKNFQIKLDNKIKNFLNNIWPSQVSVVLSANDNFSYLHRGTKKLAFRFPSNKLLLKILKKTGPLISTSANLSNQPPAINLNQAKKYFNKQINFCVDAGKILSKPSTVIEINKGKVQVLRQGSVKINY